MAEIQFGTPDSSGVYPLSLGSLRPDPANRFFEWVPDIQIIGPRRTTLGDRLQHLFAFRTDYSAKLTIKHLHPSQLDTALQLKWWLMSGYVVKMVSGDATSSYATATLKPGTEPEIVNDDDIRQHFLFRCELAQSAVGILIDYEV